MTVESDHNQQELVPTAPDARKGDPEEEATTVWGKADLFGDVETEEEDNEEDDLFGEGPRQPPATTIPGSLESVQPLTGPIHEEDAPVDVLPSDDPEGKGEEDVAATVEMTAEQAAALAAASLAAASRASAPAKAPRDAPPETPDSKRSEAPDPLLDGPTGDDLVGDGPAGEIAQARPAEDRPFEDAPLVQLSGAEKDAAEREAQERAQELDTDQTRVVKPRGPRLSHECRMCGKKIADPHPRRFRGSTRSEEGFRCDRCGNVFCATHVVRVSGILRSVLGHAVFRCQLCNLDK